VPSPAPLVDTNVISELVRPRPNAGVLRWAETLSKINLSAVTLEEVSFGLAWRPNARVANWLTNFLAKNCEVVPVTSEIARLSGEIRGRLAAKGSVRSQADMLIAATAQHHQLILVTRNARDFAGLGLTVLDPFA
jgi:toxin FitB